MSNIPWGKLNKFGFEFLSIFIGVFAAFALDNWNDNRKDKITELSILTEINQGLAQDEKDLKLNAIGHENGLFAVTYFNKLLNRETVNTDSFLTYNFLLLRNFVTVQNNSGYETLKSKGLELITNDSLRKEIISLYENDYNAIRKLEEEYSETQFHEHYAKDFNAALASHYQFKEDKLVGLKLPLALSETERNKLRLDLWYIQFNRNFLLSIYTDVDKKIKSLKEHIQDELKRN